MFLVYQKALIRISHKINCELQRENINLKGDFVLKSLSEIFIIKISGIKKKIRVKIYIFTFFILNYNKENFFNNKIQ